MLRKANDLRTYTLIATDGEIGKINDLYFDDRFWTVRYVVADTGSWVVQKPVLISPYAIRSIDEQEQQVVTELSREQIESSPTADRDASVEGDVSMKGDASMEGARPVSRRFERLYSAYYGWPKYWLGPRAWGAAAFPDVPANLPEDESAAWESHLRSINEISAYTVRALDGDIGHVEDFVVDDEAWAIRYLVIDTRNWLPGKQVVLPPAWIDEVRWDQAALHVDLAKETVETSPGFDENRQDARDYEAELCRHYGREGYLYEGCDPDADLTNLPADSDT